MCMGFNEVFAQAKKEEEERKKKKMREEGKKQTVVKDWLKGEERLKEYEKADKELGKTR